MSPYYERHLGEFLLSTNPALLQIQVIHHYLSQQSYWAQHVPEEVVQRSLENSLCFGVYRQAEQVGLARIISDKAVFAYICDVFILPEFRGKGLSKWLMQCVLEHPELQGLRKWMLGTKDAHGLYGQFGFQPLSDPTRMMERPGGHNYPGPGR